jgi:hypothetical protein
VRLTSRTCDHVALVVAGLAADAPGLIEDIDQGHYFRELSVR